MNKKKCLIIDPIHPSIFELLKNENVELNYLPDITKDEVLKIIPEYFGVFVRSKMYMGEDFFEKAKNLRFIARAGAGLDLIDIETAERYNVQLFNASEGNADAVGEHVIGMLLCLMNKMRIGDRQVRQKIWKREENRGYEINRKTVGIIGYGYMGQAVAKRLHSFGCNIVAYDKYKKNYDQTWAKESTLQELQEKCDIVSLHFPLTNENKYIVDYEYLNNFRKPFWFVNAARGEVLVTEDLIKLLETGKILGAALDVLENEKLNSLTPEQEKNFNYLSTSDKVLLTPHVAGWTYESYQKINEVLVRKIKNSNILYKHQNIEV